jgi:LCP family protein required for cell wall assembly
MPPVLPPGSHVISREHERAARIRFRRAITLMVMTLVLPGSAQLVAGNRKVGRVALRIVLLLVGLGLLLGVVTLAWHGFVYLLIKPWVLGLLRLSLIAGAVGWFVLLVDAWRLGQPLTLVKNHRLAMTGLNAVLTFAVAGTLLFSAHVVGASRVALLAASGHGGDGSANDGRYNVLLLGGDSGAGRWGLRPDSLQVASVDAKTGRTVLIGLPRNMENFHFAPGSVMDEQFPDGFDCDACYLNGVATWAGDHKSLFDADSQDPGVDATVMAVEGITGLKINYWAMVNLQGFKDVVNAVGGVKLHVREPIPVGLPSDKFYSHLKTGYYKLNGFQALWYARARHDSDDYSRMARQKCMINALAQQVSPSTVVRKLGAISEATSGLIKTNIPSGDFGKLVPLAMQARTQKISTLSLVPPLVKNTAHPDMDFIHGKVAHAIAKAEGKAAKPSGKAVVPSAATAANGETQRGGSIGTRESGYAANESTDLSSAC